MQKISALGVICKGEKGKRIPGNVINWRWGKLCSLASLPPSPPRAWWYQLHNGGGDQLQWALGSLADGKIQDLLLKGCSFDEQKNRDGRSPSKQSQLLEQCPVKSLFRSVKFFFLPALYWVSFLLFHLSELFHDKKWQHSFHFFQSLPPKKADLVKRKSIELGVIMKWKQKWTPNIQIVSWSLEVSESWESRSLGSPGVLGDLESQTMNCTFASEDLISRFQILFYLCWVGRRPHDMGCCCCCRCW